MKYENAHQMDFFLEMSEHNYSSREFFSDTLLESLDRNFCLDNVLISYFDTGGNFLSWTNRNGIMLDSEEHPYSQFGDNDVIRHIIYQDAVRDKLTYFNVIPRLYRSTDIINPVDYEHSGYVRFLEENFKAHYSIIMAFGINANVQVTFLKSLDMGDFTEEEIEALKKIYVYVANSYKNFKKHEQAKVISNIQSEIISTGEKAYLVIDDFMQVLNYNETAMRYLEDILGQAISEKMNDANICNWLRFLMGNDDDRSTSNTFELRVFKNYVFKIYTYDQSYSCGIIDKYHWITIAKNNEGDISSSSATKQLLTQAERRVAALMYNGLTYKDIADELVVSYHTVKKHVQNIYTKCGVKSRYELYKWLESNEN